MAFKSNRIGVGILDNLNVSAETRRHYKEVAGYFLDFIDAGSHRFDQPVLLWYRQYLADQPLKANSRRTYFAVARLFCQILHQLGRTGGDPTKDVLGRPIKGFQVSQHPVWGVNSREVRRLSRYPRWSGSGLHQRPTQSHYRPAALPGTASDRTPPPKC